MAGSQPIFDRDGDIAALGEGAGNTAQDILAAGTPAAAVDDDDRRAQSGLIVGSVEIEFQLLAATAAVGHIEFFVYRGGGGGCGSRGRYRRDGIAFGCGREDWRGLGLRARTIYGTRSGRGAADEQDSGE